MNKRIIITIVLIGLILFKITNIKIESVFSDEIIVINQDNWFDYITINRGKNSGIEEGDFLLSNSYLVGLITEVNEHESIVKLISNKHDKVGIKFSNTYGVISKYENGFLVVENVREQIKIGSEVKTAGFSYIYPENIAIGVVKEVIEGSSSFKILIETVDFNNFQNLEILKRDYA